MEKLVYDVGMHEGEDAEFYLERGCRVVGVEANPELVAALEKKFAPQLRSGRLCIVGKAIATARGRIGFAINRNRSIWGTISPKFMERNAAFGTAIEVVEVEAVTFEDVLAEHGVPYFMKIDIEGMDLACIDALHHMPDRPNFLSIESAATSGVSTVEDGFAELAHLWALGYRQFKYVDQARLHHLDGTRLHKEGPPAVYRHRPHASGPFGEESPGDWQDIETALARMRRLVRYQNFLGAGGKRSASPVWKVARGLRRRVMRLSSSSWYDLHARLG